MPTLPLYLPNPGHPDASHRVTAPGGYEWWYFDGEAGAGDVRFVATLYDGFPFHSDSLRRYGRYVRRPTRHAPPVPPEYPCVEFALYENGRSSRKFTTHFPPGGLTADTCRPDVRAGPHRFHRRDDGSLHLRLEDPALSADVVFRPLLPHRPQEHVLLSRAPSGAEHRRVLSDPLCSVEGSISLDCGSRVMPFNGRGHHDHHYGTAPPGAEWKSWIRGRAIVGDAVYTFDHASPRHRGLRDATHLVVADDAGVREIPAEAPTFVRSTGRGAVVLYPQSLGFGGKLMLTNPRCLDGSRRGCRVVYDAEAQGADRTGTAFCEFGQLLGPGRVDVIRAALGEMAVK